MDHGLQALDYSSGYAAMVFEQRMSEFMAVSESNHSDCSNVHPADVRRSPCNGLCKISYGKYPDNLMGFKNILTNNLEWFNH
jgi:hypothetical protein